MIDLYIKYARSLYDQLIRLRGAAQGIAATCLSATAGPRLRTSGSILFSHPNESRISGWVET